nr:TIM barrel protein [Paracoccus sp. S-4012]
MERRFEAAREAGFEGVEILFPYDFAVAEIRQGCRAAGLDFVALNTPPPNWAGGPRGFAAEPGREARFRHDFDRALRFAEALQARHIHIMAGKTDDPRAEGVFVDNLRWAAARAPHASLVIEPVNPTDLPGYFLADFDHARAVIDAVAAPNLGLLFDAYHAHMIARDIEALWAVHHPFVRHVQIAGAPGRHEPRGGEIDYPAFFRAVDASGYRGWVSAEYSPRTTTEAGLRWIEGQPAPGP